MKNYLALAHKYLSAQKKKTRLAIISVAISVALVTGVFSMLDVLLQFEKLQVIHDYGNYHLAVMDPSDREISLIASNINVQNCGRWSDLGDGVINGTPCRLGALDEAFAGNMNINVSAGKYPAQKNEIILEHWAAERLYLDVNVGDKVRIASANNAEAEFIVSGIYNDLGHMKAEGVPGVFLSMAGAGDLGPGKASLFLVEFKRGVNIKEAVGGIKTELNIADNRVALNDRLLTVMGQSEHKGAIGIYTTGAILFAIVLIAGIVMIYNTFNISVMERVRLFGLLRCIGASQEQIKKIVRREGLIIALRAIPTGIAAGVLVTLACSTLLKFYNNTLFGGLPLFNISLTGLGAGIVVGFLTVFTASLLPAKKAARVSPVNAVTGSDEIKISKNKRQGSLTKTLPVEIAMGLNSALIKKKTLFLMSSSIAISIVMFLGFQVFVGFLHTGMKTTKPYTPDLTLAAEQGIDDGFYKALSGLEGTKRVYGRMFGYVDASFDAARLTDSYKESVGGVAVKDNGRFDPPEKSWLISYDDNQLRWAKDDLLEGTLSEQKLNEGNGVIAVARHLRDNITTDTANLQLGDKVYIDTSKGAREMTVMGILRSVPFSSHEPALTTFITTEELFTGLTGESSYAVVDIQLARSGQEQTVDRIKSMLDGSVSFYDARQKNAEVNQAFFTMAVFIYGFVAVIALISILNIINTMNTSVASKTRYLGVMRAVGMSNRQLDKMVLAEAAAYSLTGGAAGCILGLILQRALITNLLTQFNIIWKFPGVQIGLILILILIVTAISVISPLKRVKAQSVSEVIGAL